MWKRVWRLKKDLRCIWSRCRHRQLMRRLEKVEGRKGPWPAAALGGVGAVWEGWRVEPVIMQSCRVRLSVTALSWAWRAQDKLKGRKTFSLPLPPSLHHPLHPLIFHSPLHLCPSLPRAWLDSGGGQQASCRLQLGPGLARSAGLPSFLPGLLSYLVIFCVSGLKVFGINYKNKRKSLSD